MSGLFWMFLTIYQVMWPLYTKLGYFRSIRHAPTQFDQHFPDRFVQNILATCLQYTELGKLKTHGQYIEEFWYILKFLTKYWIFTIYLQCTDHVFLISQAQYIVNTLQVYFEQTDQENAGRIGLVHDEWTQNIPIWYIVVTWPGILSGTFRINHSSTFWLLFNYILRYI